MENNQSQKLGAGIITVSVLHLIGAAFSILTMLVTYLNKGAVSSLLTAEQASEFNSALSGSKAVITIILALALALGVILILLKKALGVYVYFTCIILSIVNSIITSGFSWVIIFSIIFPVLMAIFINKKKELFFNKAE